jgi:hypothetical protein
MLMKNLKAQRGQALIELIIFLPLIVTLYSVIAGFANSINGSINQQKISRAYFYNRIQNNSTIPGPRLVGESYESWSQFGMFYIGWKDYFKGQGNPVMPCYKVSIPFKNGPDDKCEEQYTDTKTLWVRVGTIYGICGATYSFKDRQVHYLPDDPSIDFSKVVDKSSCTISQ